MNPEIEQLKKDVEDLKRKIESIGNSATMPKNIEDAMKDRLRLDRYEAVLGLPDGLFNAPEDAITAPTGGLTVDSQSRTAIVNIINTLETLGLVDPN